MELKDAESLIESFKKRPVKTISAIVVLLLLLCVIAFITHFCAVKGEKAAGLSKEGSHPEQSSKDLPHERKKIEPRPPIEQHTEGSQSPAVNVGPGGQSSIIYGAPEERGAKE